MGDLIKKIKIKKQDGTFTDYIPIGAEAQNVSTSDGESVQLKLNKKPCYYDTVADMKADTKLKVGDMAVTLGYYEINDGGSAKYIIRNKKEDDVEDNGSIHFINDKIVAELIFEEPKKINVLQFGIKRNVDEDQSNLVNKILQMVDKKIIYFPHGRYYFENGLVNDNRHDIIGSVNTVTDFDRSINGTRFYFTNISENEILIDCYNGSRCSIRDIYVICDNVNITLDKSLMSDGTIPKDIFTKTTKLTNVIGIRVGLFGNQIINTSVYGCNIGISLNTYNVMENVGLLCCEKGIQCSNDNVMTNINIQKCENGIILNGSLNNLSQVRLDSIREYGLIINTGSSSNNITNFIADICQYASIKLVNTYNNYISGVIGRSGTYYSNFEPSDDIDVSKACKVYLEKSSHDNKIDIIAYRGNAKDDPNDMRYISTYIVGCGFNDSSNVNNNITITGQPFEITINENTLLTIAQLSRLYKLYQGTYSGNVTYQGITYIITPTGNLNENNVKIIKPIKYNEDYAKLNSNGNLDLNGKNITNIGDMRIGDSANGWVTLSKSTTNGNLKIQNLSTSYIYSNAQITGIADPTTDNSVANKSYVDNK